MDLLTGEKALNNNNKKERKKNLKSLAMGISRISTKKEPKKYNLGNHKLKQNNFKHV